MLCQWRNIVLATVLAFSSAVMAVGRTVTVAPLSVEREQQFTYYWYAAKQALDTDDYARALVLLEFCAELNPSDALTHEWLGVLTSGLRQEDRARYHYSEAYRLAPEECWQRYAQLLIGGRKSKDLKQAEQILHKATQQHPKNEAVWRLLAYCHAYQQQYRPALQALDSCLSRNPYVPQLWELRLMLLDALKAPVEEFLVTYEMLLEMNPQNYMVLNNYAYLLATCGGDLRQAERMSMQTVQAEPNNPVYLDTYGWIMHLLGQDSLAAFYLKQALKNATADNEGEIRQHLKQVQHK